MERRNPESSYPLIGITLFLISTLISPSLIYASPGDLDPDFGSGGKVTTSIGTTDDKVNSLVIQPDGKVVAGGYSYNSTQNVFSLARYNTDGSLDSTFNTTGIVTTPIGTSNDQIKSLAIQSDGKLVAAGYSNQGGLDEFALARYNTDGSLDSTFGMDGIVTTVVGGPTPLGDQAFALVIQSDEKLVTAGYATVEGAKAFALVRYNTDGSLDTTFGTGGIVTTAIGDGRVFALAVQSDGKLVAAGRVLGSENYDFALARYNTDGSLDTTFGTGGIVTSDLAANDDNSQSLAIQSDGKLVAAGHAYTGTQYAFALARYNTDGSLDSTFNTTGIVTTPIGPSDDQIKSLAIQSDGKLVAAGHAYQGGQYKFALVRYNTDGSLDTTLGAMGIVTTAIGTVEDKANALVIQPDGKLVAAGYAENGTQYEFALARYLGDPVTTTTTTTTSTTTTTEIAATTTTTTTTSTTETTSTTTTSTTTTSTTTTTEIAATTTTTTTTSTTETTSTTTTSTTTTSTTTTTEIATTTTTTSTTSTTTTTIVVSNEPPSADSLTPVNIVTVPSVAQSFTAVYSDPDGYQNISTASLTLAGSPHNERVDYNQVTNKFSIMGLAGDCSPGDSATLTNGNLSLSCNDSSASGSGTTLTITFKLTPEPPLSGYAYLLMISVTDLAAASNSKTPGTWVINRQPGAGAASPMNSTTPVGTQQTFTILYSDPDGYQNIAAANFYLSGNGGLHNEWLHYLSAPNLFTMMGTTSVCVPGQPIVISNGFLDLDCGSSSISGSGTTLTVTFLVTPQAPSSGINYNIFNGTSDHAGAAFGTFGGTWGIP